MNVKEEIKQKLDIVDVVSLYVKLKPAGKNFVGLSPFTQEKTPSFYVSPERNLYYCFSTSQGGDIFTLVQKMEGVDFRGALKILAEKAGVSLRPEDRKGSDERDVLFSIMEEATSFFEKKLADNTSARAYLHGRGLTDQTIASFRLGFASPSWRDLHTHLTSRGYSEILIEKAGLIKAGEKGGYDRFRSRILFPIFDTSGRVVAFSGRIFIEDPSKATLDQQNAAKYLNSPDTPLFNKSEIFFGLDRAKSNIKKYDFAILVEGQMDLLMLHQIGYTNTIAGSGTALTNETVTREGLLSHMGLIQRLTKNIILAYDSDRAGVNAARKAARIALSLGMTTKVVEMPSGDDPADYVKKFGKEGWSALVKNAVSVIEMLTRRICQEEQDTLRRSRKIRDEVLPEVSLIPSAIEQEYYIDQIAKISGISKQALQKDFENQVNPPSFEQAVQPDEIGLGKDKVVHGSVSRVLGLVWYLEDKEDSIHKDALLDFTKRFSGKLYDEWYRLCENRKEELIFQVEIEMKEGVNVDKKALQEFLEHSAEDLLRYLRPVYKRSIERLEMQNDSQKMHKVMMDLNHIIRMIENTSELQQELYGNKKENNN